MPKPSSPRTLSRLETNERVLLLSLPDDEQLRSLAAQLPLGALVGMGDANEVARARAATADFDNVLFHLLDPDLIPWCDAYFHHVLDPLGTAPTSPEFALERARVTIRVSDGTALL
jgi:hypothetical protein